MHHGIYQFKQHRLIITNRLHGHILCIIMGIPHIFLPNAYYKNEAFYDTWTYSIPFCRFVKDPSQIKGAAQELLDLFPN
jgi:pyruvyl transferase EpsO